MTDPIATARNYLALWNEADGANRQERLATQWADGATYQDPMMSGTGRDEIAAMIGAAREHFPGHAFTLAGEPDGHGRFVRFGWMLGTPDGPAVAAGTDVVKLDASGRIAEVIGFLDGVDA